MARYTIDGQILTDLGDVVRGEKFEVNPKEIQNAYLYNLSITETLANYEYIPSQYTKNKITILDIEWIQEFGIGGQISLINGRTIIKTFYKDNYLAELPFSVILDGTIGFTPVRCESNVIFTIEPCDENGELIKCTYTPDEIVDEISAFPIVPSTALELTDSFNIRFASNNWNWFIDNYGHLITTSKISDLASAFKGSKGLTNIPFDLNISNKCSDFSNCFYGCEKLVVAPKIVGQMASTVVTSYSAPSFDSMFEGCHYIRELPDDYFTSLAPHEVWTSIMSSTNGNRDAIFSNCRSLRKLPDLSKLVNHRTSSSYNFYSNTFNSCYCLDEITNLPLNARLTGNGFSASSNMFTSTFSFCSRLKNITFEMNPENGNPLPAHWNKQTINLTTVGWHSAGTTMITSYNSGITADKQVTDDASYQVLKNDPDWWTTDMAYSRYNRASAVATINSLPDTSERSGANTISFKGTAGSKTDAGAISNLSEEEIAVAAAKGWTVTFA